jgi:acetyl esterase/lipase
VGDPVARVLLFIAIVAFVGALNALRPAGTHLPVRRRPPWLVAMITVELIPVRVIVWAGLLAIGGATGAFAGLEGRIALGLTAMTWAVYVILSVRAGGAGNTVHDALDEAGIVGAPSRAIEWAPLLTANPYRMPRSVERLDDIEFAPGLALDVYRHRAHDGEASPVLVQVHGGGWRGGNRRQQGRPLLHRMARRGWIALSVSYPLVPEATFPDQLIALKRALAWVRSEAEMLAGDPARVFLTGGSAGAHLAALTALTANRREYQPGFEHVDTAVQGAVTFYGIYDFLNRSGTRDPWPIIPLGVMKALPQEDPAAYRAASPLDQVHAGAPPFFVLHGSHDSLVGAGESRQFVAALRAVSANPVVYAEIPAATHAFDVVPSLRTQLTIDGVARFLEATAAAPRPDR